MPKLSDKKLGIILSSTIGVISYIITTLPAMLFVHHFHMNFLQYTSLIIIAILCNWFMAGLLMCLTIKFFLKKSE